MTPIGSAHWFGDGSGIYQEFLCEDGTRCFWALFRAGDMGEIPTMNSDAQLIHFIESYPIESFATPQHQQTVTDMRMQLIAAIRRGYHRQSAWSRDEILKAVGP